MSEESQEFDNQLRKETEDYLLEQAREKDFEKKEELFECSQCEEFVSKEEFNEDMHMCDNCINYNDCMFETMKDNEIERQVEENKLNKENNQTHESGS